MPNWSKPRWSRGAFSALVLILLALGLQLPSGASLARQAGASAATPTAPLYHFEEVMIPMRDGVRLQTVIMRQLGKGDHLPMLLRRTPYGVPDKAFAVTPPANEALAGDGYIWVFQSLRGRYKSEGTFLISTRIGPRGSAAVDEATDAYDTIEWLVRNVRGTNGRVGMTGVSYSGMTAAMALARPHPALKAISSQAAPVDQFVNDDFHRYGALRLSYAFEYAALTQSHPHALSPFAFDLADTYDWYLKQGPIAGLNRFAPAQTQAWTDLVDHPDYDSYWRDQSLPRRLRGARIPTLVVAGFWDQEDPWGPWQIFRALQGAPNAQIVAGPWAHGAWAYAEGDSLGPIPLGGATGRQFRTETEAPFFAYWLHGRGTRPAWKARVFETGANRWKDFANWPPAGGKIARLYLHGDGTLSFTPPRKAPGEPTSRSYVSDPANPVPYRKRPIGPTFTAEGDTQGWANWESEDQRFLGSRGDVLTFKSLPLDRDITIAGGVSASIFAAFSGSDGDLIVKLIDVYPEGGPEPALRGYQLPVAMEIRRGRYLRSLSRPTPLAPNVPSRWDVPLRDRFHTFGKGHRIMVQIQSSWFPLIDRNPQRFVPSIYGAKATDFTKSTVNIFTSSQRPSSIALPLQTP